MQILVLSSLVWFNLVIFWFGLVWFYIIWCVTIVQICYHAKSGACSFKNIRVIPILVLFGFCIVWFGYIIFWFGLIWFRIIWRLTIGQICYHAKSGACSFKIVRVMPIIVYFGLVWLYFGLVWYSSESFGVWPLSRYITIQNLELVASKMTELCPF